MPSTLCVLIHEGLMPVSWGKVPAVIGTADKGRTQSYADGEGWSWGSSLDRPFLCFFFLKPFQMAPFSLEFKEHIVFSQLHFVSHNCFESHSSFA